MILFEECRLIATADGCGEDVPKKEAQVWKSEHEFHYLECGNRSLYRREGIGDVGSNNES